MKASLRILAIDPGKEKCGMALVEPSQCASSSPILDRSIVSRSGMAEVLQEWLARWKPSLILLGDGTYSKVVKDLIHPFLGGIPLLMMDEHDSTFRARKLYFQHHPPKGIWRFIPEGLQVPPRPYDDFAAAWLAFRYLEKEETAGTSRIQCHSERSEESASKADLSAASQPRDDIKYIDETTTRGFYGSYRSRGLSFLLLLSLMLSSQAAFSGQRVRSKKYIHPQQSGRKIISVGKSEKTIPIHQEADELEYDDKQKTIHLSGHVKLWQEDTFLEGDDAVYRMNTEVVEAKGNLKMQDPEGTLWGDHLILSYRDKHASVDGKVRLLYIPKKKPEPSEKKKFIEKPTHVTSNKLDYLWGQKIVTANGSVSAFQEDFKAYGDSLLFEENVNRMTMDGHVHLIQKGKGDLVCDHLVYYTDTEKAVAQGHVGGSFFVQKSKGIPKPEIKTSPSRTSEPASPSASQPVSPAATPPAAPEPAPPPQAPAPSPTPESTSPTKSTP